MATNNGGSKSNKKRAHSASASAHSTRSHTQTQHSTSSKASRRPRTAKPRDPTNSALAVLRRDHQRLRQLLDEIESAQAASHRDSVLGQIETEIKQHTQIEEEIFYPAYKDAANNKADRQLFYEATEEHHVVDRVLPELRRTDPESETFAAKAKVLKDLIEHHIMEEESEMFPRARSAMSEPELVQLGEEIEDRKQQLNTAWNPLKAVTSLVTG